MHPFSGSSKAFVYLESGLDSERRFRKSLSAASSAFGGSARGGRDGTLEGISTNGSVGGEDPQLAPFDYPSPTVSSASSSVASSSSQSPPRSPHPPPSPPPPPAPAALDPPFELGRSSFPASSSSPSSSFTSGLPLAPLAPAPRIKHKHRKDVYDFASLPSPILRTTSSSTAAGALLRPRAVDPRAAEEGKWQGAMAKGFEQVASGKVEVNLSDEGLTFIPVTVTDMGNYIAVPSPFKEYKGLSHGRNYASPHRSPATSPRLAPATRTFSRVSSAPASTTAAQANLAALQGRRLVGPGSPATLATGAGHPSSPSSASSWSSVTSSATVVRFSSDETPPSSPMSTSTASTTPRAALPSSGSTTTRLLPGRPPSPGSSRRPVGHRQGVARAVTFAPGPVGPPSPAQQQRSPSLVPIHLVLSNNQIEKLPSQLFELKNLTFLTLRNNRLTSLPAAISALVNLEELNIGLNRITFLPSTILDMTSLKHATLHPNRFLPNPAFKRRSSMTATTMTMTTTNDTPTQADAAAPPRPPPPPPPPTVPTLYELCLRVLLSQRPDPTGKLAFLPPPFLTAYPDMLTLGAFASADHLRSYATVEDEVERLAAATQGWAVHVGASIHEDDARRVVACLRSAAPDKLKPSLADPPDDASENPFYEPWQTASTPLDDEAGKGEGGGGVRRVFLEPLEERTVWLPIPGTGTKEAFPVRFRGPTLGSLGQLDELDPDDDEEVGAGGDGQPREAPVARVSAAELSLADEGEEEEEGDGFDLDELDDAPAF